MGRLTGSYQQQQQPDQQQPQQMLPQQQSPQFPSSSSYYGGMQKSAAGTIKPKTEFEIFNRQSSSQSQQQQKRKARAATTVVVAPIRKASQNGFHLQHQ